MKAMIFAAGLGTRLRPLTDSIPKALVPVRGVPMLERVICRLRDGGLSEFVVNASYLSGQILEFFGSRDLGVRVEVSLEEEPLETGGGIKKASSLLAGAGRILIHNADILSDLDVRWLIRQDRALSEKDGAAATLLLTDGEADRYLLFDENMHLAGWTNVRTGEIKSPYPDFDPAAYRRFSFCGIHIISETLLPLMEEWPDKFSIIDFYLRTCASLPVCGVVADNLHLIDIGSPEKLAEAEASTI